MNSVCKKCNHVIFSETHECPSPEYFKLVRKLIADAAEACVTEETEEEVTKRYEKEVIQKQKA